jgi:serine/threonine protein kinase
MKCKYKYAVDLLDKMLQRDYRKRPDCEEILRKKHLWALNENQLDLNEESFKETYDNEFINEFLNIKIPKISLKKEEKVPKSNSELNFENRLGNGRYNKEFVEKDIIFFGSFSLVSRAEHKEIKKCFAVKKIPLNEKNEEKIIEELKFSEKLKSEFCVEYKDAWIEENYMKFCEYKTEISSRQNFEVSEFDKPYLLHIQMELCLMTLKEVMKKVNKELNQKYSKMMTVLGYYISSELFKEILEGVDYLHKNIPPIIHTDLSPTNILISNGKNGRFIKISGFGIERLYKSNMKMSPPLLETPIYTAPEVMQSNYYDVKADIYSLGVIASYLFNIDINK